MAKGQRVFVWLARCAVLLSLLVVMSGAYVRLSDAGLGCPDWPACYGQWLPKAEQVEVNPHPAEAIRPYEESKAWKEMAHRYAAGLLGLLIFALAGLALRHRGQPGQPVGIPILLAVLVVFQALLGMWTVTLLLKPAVVLAHLLGGMAILALLWWLVLQSAGYGYVSGDGHSVALRVWVVLALCVLGVQIGLGGWVSANYAAFVCTDFPTCQGSFWPPMDFREGFTFWRGVGIDYEGGVLGLEARTAIHMAHRLGALAAAVVLGGAAIHAILTGSRAARGIGCVLLILLLAQVALGIGNVLWLLPLPAAVAHNAGAALLLLATVTLLHQTQPVGRSVQA